LKPDLITFDCAQTLLEVNWRVGEFAVTSAAHAGLDLDESAAWLYSRLFREREPEFLQVNLTRNSTSVEAFWSDLTEAWLQELGHDPKVWQPPVSAAAKEIGFGPNSSIFRVYDDVIPCLDKLAALGVRTAVISNWDHSLHHIMKIMDLDRRFDLIVASLEEGFEKPDPRIFLQTLEKLGVKPDRAAHVGDHPIDDLKGARDVGMRAVLIDRGLKSPASPPYIASLLDLPGALGWND
jgi:REG-2-like HAD superfamily hydrolase